MIEFIYDVLDWGWRRVLAVYGFMVYTGLIILAITGFLLSEVIIPAFAVIMVTSLAVGIYTKLKATEGSRWTLRTVIVRPYKDWTYGRRKRKELKQKREYEGYSYEFPKN